MSIWEEDKMANWSNSPISNKFIEERHEFETSPFSPETIG